MNPEWPAIWVAFNLGVLLCLALRGLWRRYFGARASLLLWWLPPLLALASALPSGGAELATVRQTLTVQPALWTLPAALPIAPAFDWARLWVGGAVLLLIIVFGRHAWLARGWRQRARQRDPRCPSLAIVYADFGPALVGFWRPLLVLPEDFSTRFSTRQQSLVLAHELAHATAGDLRVRALALLLAIAQWWNPLGWVALLRLIDDQELACDERVLEQFPDARLDYARTLAHTVLRAAPPLLSCSMHHTHPLLRRIAMLQKFTPSARRRRLGAGLGLTLMLACSALAWATDRAAPPTVASTAEFRVALTVQIDEGSPEQFSLGDRAGQRMSAEIDSAGARLGVDLTVKQTSTPDQVLVEMHIDRDGQTLGNPALAMLLDQGGRIEIGEKDGAGKYRGVRIDVNVTRAVDLHSASPVSAASESNTGPAPMSQTLPVLFPSQAGAPAAFEAIGPFRPLQSGDGC